MQAIRPVVIIQTMSETKNRILETMSELLERQGYNGTGLNEIVKLSQTPKGSLYHYFPDGKEEIVAEAIRQKSRGIQELLRHNLAQHDDPAKAVRYHIEFMAQHLAAHECRVGAPLASVVLETATHSERLREACAEAYGNVHEVFKEKLVASGFDDATAIRLMKTIVAAVEGAMILSRAQKDNQPMLDIAASLEILIRAELPTA